MFAVLLVCMAGIVFGALRATRLQSEAGADLARVAAVQRSLDRALTVLASIPAQFQASEGTVGGSAQNLVNALRAQMETTWALPMTPEVAAITDSLRTPAAQYFASAENYARDSGANSTAATWAFADLEPRRASLENGLREAMNRMRVVLHRAETRVLAEGDRADEDRIALQAEVVAVPRRIDGRDPEGRSGEGKETETDN